MTLQELLDMVLGFIGGLFELVLGFLNGLPEWVRPPWTWDD